MEPCTFCDRPAVRGGYIQPPMCRKHHSLAIFISLLESRGQLASLENIRVLVTYYRHRSDVAPDEIEALLDPMKEHVRHGERD